MATGRIFKITKEQAGSYELLNAPRMRRRRRARSNPGVTTIMGISNPAGSKRFVRPRLSDLSQGQWDWIHTHEALTGIPHEALYDTKTGRYVVVPSSAKHKASKPSTAKQVRGKSATTTRRAPAKRAPAGSRAPGLRAVKKTQVVGGIRCLHKPAAKYERQGLTKRSQYALPQCFRYPIQTKKGKPDLPRIRRALSYYGRNKSRYSRAVRAQIERGIAKAAKDAGLSSPKAMEYRRKFGLANPGEDSMLVMRKNKARRKPRSKYGRFAEVVLFPARGKSARGVSGYTRNLSRKKKAAKPNLARGSRIVIGPEPKNKKTKAWRSWNGRRAAAIRLGQVSAKTATAKRAPKKASSRRAAAKPAARKTSAVKRVRTRAGSLRIHRTSKPGSGRFSFLEISGAKRASVRRGPTSKKRGKTLKVAVRNINGKPSTWYANKTKAVANLMRSYARANAAMTDDPSTWGRSAGGLGSGIRRKRGEATMEGATWGDSTTAAAAAAATGVAPQAFSTVADFEKWLQHMLKSSPKFRGVYASWLRKKYRAKTAAEKPAKKKAKKMAAKRNAKRRPAGKLARKPARKKPRTTRAMCKKLRGRGKPGKKYMSCISRLPKSRKKSTRRSTKVGTRRTRVAARRPTKKNRRIRRRARRNMAMKARANQMFARVTALAKPTAFMLAGLVAHRMLTTLASKFLSPMLNSPTISSVVSNLGVLVLGAAASNKVLPANANLLSMGMAVDAGLSIIGELFPQAKEYLGLGVMAENTRARYVLNGMGQPILQAAAGMGQPILQAAAGTGAYYTPMGEYVSNDVYPSGGDFGEYVASSLDVQGYGDYEVSDTYGMSGGGYMDDGVRPDGDLGREFAIMEAKAGVGQPIMQAAAGLPTASIYIPSQGAGIVRSSENAYDAGIFDIGGGNGVLS